MLHHGISDRHRVHDAGDLAHVEIVAVATHSPELILDADIDDEGAGRHEMAGGDQFAEPDLVRDVREHLAQPDLVAAVRRGGDAVDPAVGVAIQGAIDDAAIAVRDGVMRLVDHQQV